MHFTFIPWEKRTGLGAFRNGLIYSSLGVAALLFNAGIESTARAAMTTAPDTVHQATDSAVSFFAPKTRLWLGRPQMICFQIQQPAAQDRFFSFQVDENVVHLLVPPQILKGEKIGYLRVMPLTAGTTWITVANATLPVDIAQDSSTGAMDELHPQIVTPASGSMVWGKFAVGVEQLTFGDPSLLSAPTLRLSNGQEITGKAVPDQTINPHARWVFTVDAANLDPGENKLVVVSNDAQGREYNSAPIYVNAIHPAPGAMLTGSCIDAQDQDRPANAGGPPPVVDDKKYGQGKIINASNDGAPWCLPLWVSQPGDYQLMVTARGDLGADAMPSLALMVDELPQVQTISRLATTEWQRMPVGHPFTLTEGGHFISVRLRNSMSVSPSDARNLFLQKYELVRITPASAPAPASPGDGGAMTSMTVAAGASMAMASGGSMMSMAGASAAGGVSTENLHLAFLDNLDGQTVAGPVEVRARSWFAKDSPPPRIELFVNKRTVGTQTARDARFVIDPAAFTAGSNLVEMRAVFASGAAVNSVPFTLQVPTGFPMPKHPFRPTLTYTTYDSGLGKITPPEPPGDPAMATFDGNGTSTITLPENLIGKYRVMVAAQGDVFQGPPNLQVGLVTGGQETKLADVAVQAKPSSYPAGTVNLTTGPKALTIAFTNDAYVKGQGDRNLYVKSVRLVPADDQPDKTPPVITVAEAPKTIGLGSTDAVVARVLSGQTLASADITVDGHPEHFDQTPLHGLGLIVFPILARDLKPGTHTFQIVAKDNAGNTASTSTTSFTISASAETALNKYERAIFLLNRFGYGPDPTQIATILTRGETNWLQAALAQDDTAPSELNESEFLRAQFPDRHNGGEILNGAIAYLLTEPNPVRARFVMWTENHFSTWMSKDQVPAKATEHENFMKVGPAPFFDLLFTSATSPAMLFYLDQIHSYSHALNENYAREIMELHTLGVNGGYTQKDVTTLADLLTGWTLSNGAACDGAGGFDLDRFFGYDPNLNSGNGCRIFGVQFPAADPDKRYDRVLMALELLTAHPSCAHFISRKLCEHYVADPAPPKLVDDLAQVYLETGGDTRAMLVAMSQHPDFWASTGKIANPIDFGVRTARMARSTDPSPVNTFLTASGMGMFDRATPDGYPEDNGYSANSNALLQRWHFAKSVENSFVSGKLIPDSLRPTDTGWDATTTQAIVDHAAVRMTGNVLGDSSNEAAQKLIASAPPNTDLRLHTLATFICQLPENSLK